jgi:hypothetical protein
MSACTAKRGWPIQPLGAAAAAILLSLVFQHFGLLDMPMPPGCGPGLALIEANLTLALRMAALMTVIGVLVPRPALLTSGRGLLRLGLWVLGLTLFGLIEMQTGMAAMAAESPMLEAVLTYAPLATGLAFALLVPTGESCCIAFMLAMSHFGLMAWPWMGLCALLGSIGEGGLRRFLPVARAA